MTSPGSARSVPEAQWVVEPPPGAEEQQPSEPPYVWVIPEASKPVLRLTVLGRPIDGGRVLAFARELPCAFAEGADASDALTEFQGVAREVVSLFRERGAPVPFATVPGELGDEIIGSVLVDA